MSYQEILLNSRINQEMICDGTIGWLAERTLFAPGEHTNSPIRNTMWAVRMRVEYGPVGEFGYRWVGADL